MKYKFHSFLLGAFFIAAMAVTPVIFSNDAFAASASHDEAGDTDALQFVRLDPLTLPIIDGDGVSQTVSLVIVLEVDKEDKVKQIKKLTPRLKDAYIQNMYGLLNQKATMTNGVLQVSHIKSQISKVTHKIMGEGFVDAVLLETVQQRPI